MFKLYSQGKNIEEYEENTKCRISKLVKSNKLPFCIKKIAIGANVKAYGIYQINYCE